MSTVYEWTVTYHSKVNRQNPNFDLTKDIFDYNEWNILHKNILQSCSEIMATAAKFGVFHVATSNVKLLQLSIRGL